MNGSPGHILVVDDDPQILEGYVRLIAAHGYLVEGARDGKEAIERLEAGRFDAVLSDVHMPRAGGLDVLAGIRTRDLDVPVILMSGDPTLHSAITAVAEGAVAYLLKPILRNKLLPALERAVRLGQLARLKRAALALAGVDGHPVGERAGLRVCFEQALVTLRPVFQPIVDWPARRVLGYEALMRSEERLLPHPADVLAAALRLDRLFEVGRAMRAHTARDAGQLPSGADLYVNLHPHDLLDDELYDPGAPLSALAGRTVLELTERATLDQIPNVEPRVGRLRKLGFRLAVDDLGAGYAGLNSLVQIQPDIVKLDMVLVRGVDHDEPRQRIVEALIALSGRLGMKVVCEGVETEGERDFLHGVGGSVQQGFLYAPPAPGLPVVRWGAS